MRFVERLEHHCFTAFGHITDGVPFPNRLATRASHIPMYNNPVLKKSSMMPIVTAFRSLDWPAGRKGISDRVIALMQQEALDLAHPARLCASCHLTAIFGLVRVLGRGPPASHWVEDGTTLRELVATLLQHFTGRL
ncbi:hypothetical protein M436DRAFT_62770 [Aureobasidium namibiae CBS 147.97]|uniref:Uncharacterized protein n=1 Tax=Aureobasidium namibiae CBS 147.97 TaxID=1043004 RepID=A0A074XII2_9PEZI|nr:uncharacterized protein M436DRAFT_62770 [Aureobasidium namibiae CBS 147.97]KEQ74376.1 hypothetical protein M436DRAFT_62770 [Aureobasidium namibiae CBS 147.97]